MVWFVLRKLNNNRFWSCITKNNFIRKIITILITILCIGMTVSSAVSNFYLFSIQTAINSHFDLWNVVKIKNTLTNKNLFFQLFFKVKIILRFFLFFFWRFSWANMEWSCFIFLNESVFIWQLLYFLDYEEF